MRPTLPIRVPMKYRCVAEVVVDDDDRPPYVPPPVAKGEHDARCRCDACLAARALGYTGA